MGIDLTELERWAAGILDDQAKADLQAAHSAMWAIVDLLMYRERACYQDVYNVVMREYRTHMALFEDHLGGCVPPELAWKESRRFFESQLEIEERKGMN